METKTKGILVADITEKQLKTLKKLIESAETNLAGAKELLTSLIGSDTTVSPAEAKGAGKPLADFIRQSIVEPNAYVEPHFPKNVMPSTFAQLPKNQLDALVQYLLQSRKGGK